MKKPDRPFPTGESRKRLSPPERDQLYREQVVLLARNAPVGLVGTAVSFSILVYLLWGSVSSVDLLFLSGIVIVVTGVRAAVLVSFWKKPPEPKHLERWCAVYGVGIVLSGLCWGGGGFYLMSETSMINQVFITFLAGGVAVGATGIYTPVPWGGPAFVLPALLPIAGSFIFRGGVLDHTMGFTLLLFTALILTAFRSVHRAVIASLQLQLENRGLISHLENAKDRAEKLNEELQSEMAERAQVYEALHESETRYRSLVETSQDLIWRCDSEGRFTYLNPAWERALGYTLDEMLNRPFTDFKKPETAERDYATFKDILRGRPVSDYETTYLKKGGGEVYLVFKATHLRDKDGTVIGTQGTAYDITKRKQAEKALRESEEKFSRIFHNSPDAVIISHIEDGVLVDVNDSFLAISGYTRDEVLGEKSTDLDLWVNRKERDSYIDELRAKGKINNVEMTFRKKDGTTATALLSSSLLELRGLPCVITLARDITDLKKAQEVLDQQLAAMRASSDGIAIHDSDNRYIFINEAYARIYGFDSPEMMMNTFWEERYNTVELHKFEREFFPQLHKNGFWKGEALAIKRDGTVFPQEISLSRVAAGGIICIVRDISQRHLAEKTTSALYNISKAATSDISLDELYKYIHLYLGTIIDTTNFFIALYDGKTDTISTPYFVDQHYKKFSPYTAEGSGFSEAQVILSKKSYCRTEEEYREKVKKGEAKPLYHVAKVWVGVPLIHRNEIIGAMVVKSYNNPNLYSKDDIALLEFVSDQVATAIESKRTAEALLMSEERLKNLSRQTEQFSLAAASIYSVKKEQDIFDRICRSIVDISDFSEVFICFFTEHPPYHEIIGHAGVDGKTIRKMRSIEVSREKMLGIFESAGRVGQSSYYISNGAQGIFAAAGTTAEQTPSTTRDELCWKENNHLALRMNDAEGNLVGVINVRKSRSGQLPDDETVRPLEIFSSLISQIIIQKKSEQKLKQLEEQLFQSQKMESIGKLAGGIAHDFNNILAIVMGYADMLKLQFPDESTEGGKAADRIFQNVKRAADLTGQLLSLARGGKHNPQPLDINEEIKEIVTVSGKIFEKDITVKFNFEKDLYTVEADKNKIGQVFTNLIINSRDAMPGGGTVTFTTENVPHSIAQTLGLPGLEPGPHVKISVHDTGTGMEKPVKDRVFEPFFSGKAKGLGLGLATAYRIIRNHRGHISVESSHRRGTTFQIYLPAAEKQVKHRKLRTRTTKKIVSGCGTVLVVDDEKDVNNLIKTMLESMGYTVIQAADGQEAVDVFTRSGREIDLVLLDLIMPNMAGPEAFYALRSLDPEAKILLISGYSQSSITNDLIKNGARGFIPKPFELHRLSRCVADALKT